MASLVKGILQRGGGLFFLFLQGVCWIIITSFNSEQGVVADATIGLYADWFTETYDDLRDYGALREQVNILRRENASLREQISSSLYFNDSQIDTSTYNDSTLQRYTFIEADIINKTPLSNNNFFTIDRGKNQGVEKHMGVISSSGIIGVVVGVSNNFARVMTVLSRQSSVSASIQKKPFFGSLVWDSTDPRYMQLEAVPKHAKIAEGDTIVTSGFSHIFPAEIKLGWVVNNKLESGENSLTIKVEMFDNIMKAEHAYVVKDLMKEEVEAIE